MVLRVHSIAAAAGGGGSSGGSSSGGGGYSGNGGGAVAAEIDGGEGKEERANISTRPSGLGMEVTDRPRDETPPPLDPTPLDVDHHFLVSPAPSLLLIHTSPPTTHPITPHLLTHTHTHTHIS